MPMVPFHTKFPALAARETRALILHGQADLPDGEYGFIELYCNEETCDCRRVVINVMTPATGAQIWATINYGWETVAFYEQWLGSKRDALDCQGASLDPLNPQTKYAPALLQRFNSLLRDEVYRERLKQHYYLFKGVTAETAGLQKQRSSRKRRTRKRKKGL